MIDLYEKNGFWTSRNLIMVLIASLKKKIKIGEEQPEEMQKIDWAISLSRLYPAIFLPCYRFHIRWQEVCGSEQGRSKIDFTA
jgi:hypothetical protein